MSYLIKNFKTIIYFIRFLADHPISDSGLISNFLDFITFYRILHRPDYRFNHGLGQI